MMARLDKLEHPMQPIAFAADCVMRFKMNTIVRYLLDNGGLDLNTLAGIPFAKDDWDQFYQLIGYSVSGYLELQNVSDDAKYAAYDEARRVAKGA